MKKTKNFGGKRTYFVFPYLFLSIVFVIIPLGFILAYAFKDSNGSFSLNAFKRFEEGYLWDVIGNSFLVAFLTTAICLAICYPLAMALVRLKTNRTAVLVMLFIMPMWINSLLRLYAVRMLFADVIELGFTLVVIGMVYDFLPFMLLPIYTILSNMDKSVLEASSDLGASPLRTLFKVKIPLSMPGIVSGVLLVFMPVISSFAVSDILSLKNFVLFGNLINMQYEQQRYANASAYSIMLMLLIATSVLIANRVSKGKAAATASSGGTV